MKAENLERIHVTINVMQWVQEHLIALDKEKNKKYIDALEMCQNEMMKMIKK